MIVNINQIIIPMKKIKKTVLIVLLIIFTNILMGATSKENKLTITEQTISAAEQVYDRMVVSTRIIRFTDKYIDSKRVQKPNIPDSIWQSIKNAIDYSFFRAGAIQILNNNFTNQELIRLISEFRDKPLIPIPNLKVKKELFDLGDNFQAIIDSKILEILTANGY